MTDPRFTTAGALGLGDLAKAIGATIFDGADPDFRMADVSSIEAPDPGTLCYALTAAMRASHRRANRGGPGDRRGRVRRAARHDRAHPSRTRRRVPRRRGRSFILMPAASSARARRHHRPDSGAWGRRHPRPASSSAPAPGSARARTCGLCGDRARRLHRTQQLYPDRTLPSPMR